jgi:hypothetical protein
MQKVEDEEHQPGRVALVRAWVVLAAARTDS